MPTAKREKVSEWWEVWICVPKKRPERLRHSGGYYKDFRLHPEAFGSSEEARDLVRRAANKYAKIVHVVRYRRLKSGSTLD